MYNNTKFCRNTQSQDIYSKAGIKDIADFYQEKFVSSTKAALPNGIDGYICGAQIYQQTQKFLMASYIACALTLNAYLSTNCIRL